MIPREFSATMNPFHISATEAAQDVQEELFLSFLKANFVQFAPREFNAEGRSVALVDPFRARLSHLSHGKIPAIFLKILVESLEQRGYIVMVFPDKHQRLTVRQLQPDLPLLKRHPKRKPSQEQLRYIWRMAKRKQRHNLKKKIDQQQKDMQLSLFTLPNSASGFYSSSDSSSGFTPLPGA
jgi:hypothetical protein